MEERNKRLRRLILREPEKYLWPAVINVMLELGWKPPPMKSSTMDRLMDDMSRIGGDTVTSATLELSPTQLRILQYTADGFTREQVGREIGIGDETMKSYTKKMRQRLGARNAAHAVAIGFRLGIIK